MADYLEILSGHALQQRKFRHHELFQRRNQMTDQYVRYYAGGFNGTPARVRIPISTDIINYSKWEMKIEINPYINGSGTFTPTTATQYQLYIDGVDMTAYFKLQYHGYWLHGNGIYPNAQMSTYDVLSACKYMSDEERQTVLKPGYKIVELFGDGNFTMAIDNHLKYNFMNR